LLGLVGCAHQPDPLSRERLALEELADLAPGWGAQASLSFDPDLIAGWIADTVAIELQQLPTSMTIPGGLLGDLALEQTLSVAPVEVAVAGGVLHVATPVRGDVEVVWSTLLGRAVENLTWTGTVLCAYEIVLHESSVLARPHEPERWGLELVLGERSDALDATLGVFLEEVMRASLSLTPPEPWVLAELPDAMLRDLRLRPGADALVVDFAFEVLNPGLVGDVPAPNGGFVAVLPEQTALALVQAALLAEPPSAEIVEPISLSLEGSSFELGVRHHVASGVISRRLYSLTGTLVLQDGVLWVQPESVRVLGGTVRANLSEDHWLKLLANLTQALTVSVPARSSALVAGQNRSVEAVRVLSVDHQLIVWGAVGD
jgi:hypothetical protein